jgi:hypothetical protein
MNSEDARAAGALAYAAGQPFQEPGEYLFAGAAAAWRLGWKKAAAAAGDIEAFDRAVLLTEQRRLLTII